MNHIKIICAFVFCTLLVQASVSYSYDKAAYRASVERNSKVVIEPRDKYTDAVTFYLIGQDALEQLQAEQAAIDRLVAQGKMEPSKRGTHWRGYPARLKVKPNLPESDKKKASLCRQVGSGMPGDVLYRKAAQYGELEATQRQEAESFWREYYKTMDKNAKAQIDEHMAGRPDTRERKRIDYAQVALEAPDGFRTFLEKVCGSQVAQRGTQP